ncbi:putative alpha-L-fucosidase [Dioscorea sansibarensis]
MLALLQLARPPLKWQRRKIMFFHFGVNTFTDSEWGSRHESLLLFNLTSLDANQWVAAAVDVGVSLVILIAKHHTDHTVVEKSLWEGGKRCREIAC